MLIPWIPAGGLGYRGTMVTGGLGALMRGFNPQLGEMDAEVRIPLRAAVLPGRTGEAASPRRATILPTREAEIRRPRGVEVQHVD